MGCFLKASYLRYFSKSRLYWRSKGIRPTYSCPGLPVFFVSAEACLLFLASPRFPPLYLVLPAFLTGGPTFHAIARLSRGGHCQPFPPVIARSPDVTFHVIASAILLHCHCEEARFIGATWQSPGFRTLARSIIEAVAPVQAEKVLTLDGGHEADRDMQRKG
jgi:hypothetical protein